jgi:hypothetical protein
MSGSDDASEVVLKRDGLEGQAAKPEGRGEEEDDGSVSEEELNAIEAFLLSQVLEILKA